jgi:hypothetical protein
MFDKELLTVWRGISEGVGTVVKGMLEPTTKIYPSPNSLPTQSHNNGATIIAARVQIVFPPIQRRSQHHTSLAFYQ